MKHKHIIPQGLSLRYIALIHPVIIHLIIIYSESMTCANFYYLLVPNMIIIRTWYFNFIHLSHVIFPETGVLSMCVIYSYLLTILVKTIVVLKNFHWDA